MFFGGHLNSVSLSNNMFWRVDFTEKFSKDLSEKDKADKFIFIPCHCQQLPNQQEAL